MVQQFHSWVLPPKNEKCQLLSHVQLFAIPRTIAYQALLSMEFSWQEYWSGLPFLLQGIFLTQELNLGLLNCRLILYHLSHQGSQEFKWILVCEHLQQLYSVTKRSPSTDDWTSTEWAVHAAEYHSALSYNMNEPTKPYAEWSGLTAKVTHILWSHLCEMPRGGESPETENGAPRGWEREEWGWLPLSTTPFEISEVLWS